MPSTSDSDYAKVAQAVEALKQSHGRSPSREEASRRTGVSEASLQALFQRWAGVGLDDFLRVLTSEYMRRLLEDGASLSYQACGAGLREPEGYAGVSLNSEVIESSEYPARSTSLRVHWGFHPSPFGCALLGVAGDALCHLAFIPNPDPAQNADAVKELERTWPGADIAQSQKRTAAIAGRIFTLRPPPPRVPPLSVLLKGTPFQIKVWRALTRLPFGTVTTYGRLASALGAPGASRAVGSAVAANAIGFLVPCHRVIRQTGLVGEYRWGFIRKRAILAWEACKKNP